jgi:hypothetical protein
MDEEVKSAYVFGGRRITIRTVDLSQPGLAGLREAASEIVATL